LTTALCLHERGISSTIIADKFMPHITSAVAGALWEWPPAVCGYHHDQISLERSKTWSMQSFRRFEKLAADPATGVFVRPVNFYFRNKIEEHDFHLAKLNEIKEHVPGFARDADLIRRNGVNQAIGLVDAYRHLAPMVDTDVYMAWLMAKVRATGAGIVQRRLEGDLRDQEAALKQEFRADVIVNCSGLGARDLASEPMFPLRGAVIRLINDGIAAPLLEQAHCVSHDNVTSDQEIVFIVPRGRNRIVLGAIAEADQWSTDISLSNYEPVRRMYERCMEFLPMLRNAKIDPDGQVRVGLRPFRKQNVRLDQVPHTTILHNYGHGGAGVTFSWGCGTEVADRVERLFADDTGTFQAAA
jgi:D-amino-acid oxidase